MFKRLKSGVYTKNHKSLTYVIFCRNHSHDQLIGKV